MPTEATEEEIRKAKKAKKLAKLAKANGEDSPIKKKKKKNRDRDEAGGDDGEVSASDRKVKKGDNAKKRGVTEYVNGVNELQARKQEISDDMTLLMAEAKAEGYTPKAIKAAAKLTRDSEMEKHRELEDLTNSYLSMMGIKPR